MASKINTVEYSYCSAKIRALENSIISAEQMRALVECATYSEAMAKLEEYGVSLVTDNEQNADLEATLQRKFADACDVLCEVPAPQNYNFLRYPYDCNNLKACIKCSIRNISPDSMLSDCGVFSADEAKAAIKGEFSGYPEHMSAAIVQATEAYAKTKSPQLIDLILDRACYADMLTCAEASGCDYLVDLVRTKIDTVNIITYVRLMRMRMGASGRDMLARAILEGGKYNSAFFCEMYEAGEGKLCEALAFSDYGKLISCICENPDGLSNVEKYADNLYIEKAKRAKLIAFGPEVAAAYIIAVEYEVKNLRIILDGKRTGKSAETINERLRYSYV